MTIPKSFNDFTVKQFQEWHRITSNYKGEEREYRLLASLLDITLEECENITFKELIPLLKELNSIDQTINKKVKSIIVLNKKCYVAITNPKQLKELLSTNQYTAAQMYTQTQDSAIQNLDKLLALFYSPFKLFRKPKLADNQQYLADQFQSAKIGDVYGAVFFYSVVWEKYQPILESQLDQSLKIIADHLKEIQQENGSQ